MALFKKTQRIKTSGTRFTTTRGWLAVTLVAFLTGGAVIAVTAFTLSDSDEPETFSGGTSGTTVTATQRDFDDASSRDIEFNLASGIPLTTPASGLITATSCTPGGTIESGDEVAEIDGEPVIALTTKRPLWRDLNLGDKGKDITGLHKALKKGDYGNVSGNKVTQETLKAAAKALNKSKLQSIPHDRIMWLPAHKVNTRTCEINVGEITAEGEPFAQLDPQPERATVSNWSPESDGEYQLTIDDTTVTMPSEGVITDSDDLQELADTDAFKMEAGEETPMVMARTELDEPVTVWTIPPSSVQDNGENTCVENDGDATPVTVIASELGQTLVQTQDDEPLGDITLKPATTLDC